MSGSSCRRLVRLRARIAAPALFQRDIVSEGVATTRASLWHNAGLTGAVHELTTEQRQAVAAYVEGGPVAQRHAPLLEASPALTRPLEDKMYVRDVVFTTGIVDAGEHGRAAVNDDVVASLVLVPVRQIRVEPQPRSRRRLDWMRLR